MKAKLFDILPFFIPIVLVVGVLLTISYAPKKEATTKCTTSDYAHIPYAEEYKFECTDDTITIIDDFTDEVIATEKRCTEGQLKAEDGSCVDGDFYVNTDALMLTTSEGSSATSGGGLFVNPNGKSTSIANNNDYRVGVDLQPQRLTNGKWIDLGWSDYLDVSPRTGVLENHLGDEPGTFRYKVTTYTYDKDGNTIEKDKFYTGKVQID